MIVPKVLYIFFSFHIQHFDLFSARRRAFLLQLTRHKQEFNEKIISDVSFLLLLPVRASLSRGPLFEALEMKSRGKQNNAFAFKEFRAEAF